MFHKTVLNGLTEAYNTAAEAAQGTPGATTSTVRAFASLLVDQLNATSTASPEEINEYQARLSEHTSCLLKRTVQNAQ